MIVLTSNRRCAANPAAQPLPKSPKTKAFEGVVMYYGYRFYDPETGRWPSRDPLDEGWATRELNLYVLLLNAPNQWIDILGLQMSMAGLTTEELIMLGYISVGAAATYPLVEHPPRLPDISIPDIRPEPVNVPANPPKQKKKLDPEQKPSPKPDPKTGPTIPIDPTSPKSKCCEEKNPTWPACKGPSDPRQAVIDLARILPYGLYLNLHTLSKTDTGIASSRPAHPEACPSGGTWYSIHASTALIEGTITAYNIQLSVVCCNCCRKGISSVSCRVIHPDRGSNNTPGVPGWGRF